MPRLYKRKNNKKRFFYPQEWMKFLNGMTKPSQQNHKFLFEFLLHTGTRINEARNVQIKDIDFERKCLLVKKPKRSLGQDNKERTIEVSTYLLNRIKNHIQSNNLGKLDYLGFPSTVYMDKAIKKYCKEVGILDFEDFSCHNTRKTLETWCAAGLNINPMVLSVHFGHTIDIATMHYVGMSMLKPEDKSLIKAIIDDLFDKK
jgi:integrase